MLLFQVLLVILCSSELLVKVDGAPQGKQLTEVQEVLINEVPTHLLPPRLVSGLTTSGGTVMLRQLEDKELGGGQERLLRRQIRFSHRERKAGCRNFFWKTFTSC